MAEDNEINATDIQSVKFDELVNFFTSKKIELKCKECGVVDPAITSARKENEDILYAAVSQSLIANESSEANTLFYFNVSCQNCGYVRLFNAKGITEQIHKSKNTEGGE